MDNDFLLDEDEDLGGEAYIGSPEDDAAEDDTTDDISIDGDTSDDSNLPEKPGKKVKGLYDGKMTKDEIWLSSAYNDILNSSSKDIGKISVGGGRAFDSTIVDAVRSIIMANPINTSTTTVELITKEFFQAQGHSRIVSSLYTPDHPLRSEDIDNKFGGDDDSEFNQQFTSEARDQVARFIEYLATQDLSKDSIISRRRKQRQIPAFIIFLFSSGLYDLIIGCSTMPPEYDEQIKKALERISRAKDDVVEALAKRYEEHNRPEVAKRVRKLGTAWFEREPAEIRTTAEYSDLNLTQQDVVDYREFRSRFTNVSKSLTQDAISDMVEVVLDKDAGIYERLKDKTRSDAIADVKQVYKEWAKNNPVDSNLAEHIIWNDIKQ